MEKDGEDGRGTIGLCVQSLCWQIEESSADRQGCRQEQPGFVSEDGRHASLFNGGAPTFEVLLSLEQAAPSQPASREPGSLQIC